MLLDCTGEYASLMCNIEQYSGFLLNIVTLVLQCPGRSTVSSQRPVFLKDEKHPPFLQGVGKIICELG